jgi:hypothetical protein
MARWPQRRVAEAPASVLAIGAQPGVTFAPSEWERRELRKNGRFSGCRRRPSTCKVGREPLPAGGGPPCVF